jgi:hypothetical protein
LPRTGCQTSIVWEPTCTCSIDMAFRVGRDHRAVTATRRVGRIPVVPAEHEKRRL